MGLSWAWSQRQEFISATSAQTWRKQSSSWIRGNAANIMIGYNAMSKFLTSCFEAASWRRITLILLETLKHCTKFSRFIWDSKCNTTLCVLCTSAKESHPKALGTNWKDIEQMLSRTLQCWNLWIMLQYEESIAADCRRSSPFVLLIMVKG